MNKKMTFLLVAITIVIIGGYFILNNHQVSNNGINKNNPSNNNNQNQRVKLSDTQYWNYASLISGDSLDNKAKTALSGFELNKEKLSNGDIKITLKALSPKYNDQVYTLKNGERLYFIETSLGDDLQFKEYNPGDDRGVITDANDYIIKP